MKRFALTIAAAASVFTLAVGEIQAIPPTVPTKPLPVPGPVWFPPQPPANPWRAFNGNTALVKVDTSQPGRPTKKTVATVNLKDSLNALFDSNVPDIKKTFLTKLGDKKLTGYRLYNTKVSIAPSSNAYLELAVFNSKSFALTYVGPLLVSILIVSSRKNLDRRQGQTDGSPRLRRPREARSRPGRPLLYEQTP